MTFKTYSHLNIPDQWNEYFSKYPNGYTILEAIINWAGQVNDMTDTLNSTSDYVNNFMATFDTNLSQEVTDTLTTWKDDGTLDTIISSVVNGRLADLTLFNDDYDTFQLALTDAYTKGQPLTLGNKNLVITTYVSNIHDVILLGFGSLTRGTDTFYFNPLPSQTNKLYVSPLGNDTWDGLTSDRPIKTIAKVAQIIQHYANPVLKGTWQIILAAGTYGESVTIDRLMSVNPIQFIGAPAGFPVVPSTLISKGEGATAVGLMGRYGTKLFLQDIKFSGFNGSTSSGGCIVAYNAELETSNVHTDSCYYGISGEHQSAITIPDGTHTKFGCLTGQTTGGGAAIRSLQQTNHYIGIQNATDRSKGPLIDGTGVSSIGFDAQELSTGHFNWGTIKNCADGVRGLVMARANLDGVLFSGNARDIRVDSNSHVFITPNTTFDGTSQETIVQESGGKMTGAVLTAETDESYTIDERTYALQSPNQTITTNTATAFHTQTLKFPHWKTLNNSIAQGRTIKFKVLGNLNGATNIKRLNVRLNDGTVNSHTGLTFAAGDTGSFFFEGEIYFTANGKQVIACRGARHLEPSIQVVRLDSTVPMTKDTVFTLEASVDDTTGVDNVLIDAFEVSISG